MDAKTLKYYETQAASLAERYQTASDGVARWFDEAFDGFAKILDVGCGAGRDLRLLLQRGHDAIGADRSREMLAMAAETCRQKGLDPQGRLVHDGLPDLTSFANAEFDGLLCSAVLMHLPEERLFDSIYGMRRVLRPGGRLLLSIPEMRPDIDPATRRDRDGRYFADLPPAKLKLLMERVGFNLLWERVSDDALGRSGYSWITFLFNRQDEDAERPLDQVESILNRDKKDATYKLALFRALADIAQTQYNIASYDLPGRVGIPIRALAERWLVYYWPIVASETFIAQKHGESPDCSKSIAIRAPLNNLIGAFREAGGLPAFMVALKNGGLTHPVQRLYVDAMRKIESTIWDKPVRHAGGGEHFSVLGYDKTTHRVTMPAALWRELTLTGSWILDATILRWAELTERLSKGAVNVSLVVEKLLSISDPQRETRDARILFAKIGASECAWTGKTIRVPRFDVDHVIPFTLWRNNDLWNLLPTHPSVNNQKRDYLPTQDILRKRYDTIIAYWEALRGEYEERFDREAATLCGVVSVPKNGWQTLFSRMAEAVEIIAVQRRVPRWEPGDLATPSHKVISTAAQKQEHRSRKALATVKSQKKAPHEETDRSPAVFNFSDIRDDAFKRYLPVVGALAAGEWYSGFDITDLEAASECPWVAVPERLAGRNRFVVRINGDSMEPELNVGDLVIFEYHRTARAPGQIVIANIADFGPVSDLATDQAVKRIGQDSQDWIFKSTNSRYGDIRVSKAICSYPILGIMVARL